ncbi:MAG: hypothetical protein PHW86_02650, partial [Candidatus Bipolaricaulis sp.]|nr:hypothetical protein [Candidatus Bipolaricaulis sp.]
MRKIVLAVALSMAMAYSLAATTAEMYFATDAEGQNRITRVQEGTSLFIVVHDPDENIDCDVRDKIWTDVKLMDPKTGAYLVWVSYMTEGGDAQDAEYDDAGYVPYKGHYPGPTQGWLGDDYLEETGADTGVFVSARPFQIGSRESYDVPRMNTHVVSSSLHPTETALLDFDFGNFLFMDGVRVYIDDNLNRQLVALPRGNDGPAFPDAAIRGPMAADWLVGRFENMDTLIGMYQDPNDDTDVAVTMMKIVDVEATIAWDEEMYPDGNEAAKITVVDPDENLNCNRVEYVPVFIIVNPGSWNPSDPIGRSPTNFCMLKRTGGIDGVTGVVGTIPMTWCTMYHSRWNAFQARGAMDGRYYIQYATLVGDPNNVAFFDTLDPDGITPVSFFARETGVDTGVFELRLNSILADLGFSSLNDGDVLVAYYLDPNDEDDFKLAAAYIGRRDHISRTRFTDASRAEKNLFWLGRDAVYVQVIDENANVDPCCPEQVVVHLCDVHEEDDAEWLVLDETSMNSSVFWTMAGIQLRSVWDALGVGEPAIALSAKVLAPTGGYQLVLDNWRIEAFNEDDVYARYNDVYYGAPSAVVTPSAVVARIGDDVHPVIGNDGSPGLSGLG